MKNSDITSRLITIRESRGKSNLEKFSKEIGVDYQAYRRFEQGESFTSAIDLIQKLINGLKLTPSELYFLFTGVSIAPETDESKGRMLEKLEHLAIVICEMQSEIIKQAEEMAKLKTALAEIKNKKRGIDK